MLHISVVLLGIGVGIGIYIPGCQADCNVCTVNTNIACISDREYQFCVENRPAGPVNRCDEDYYCTSDTIICQKNEALNACRDCNRCNDQLTFACTGPRTFALCQGRNILSNSTGSCSEDSVCAHYNPFICGDELETPATCPWLSKETTTEIAIVNTTESTTPETTTRSPSICHRAWNGKPLLAIPNDRECTSYIYCEYSFHSWVEHILECPWSKPYFNARTLQCGRIKPRLPGCL